MNKKYDVSVKILRAKMNAQEAVQKYLIAWYGEEPEEISDANSIEPNSADIPDDIDVGPQAAAGPVRSEE